LEFVISVEIFKAHVKKLEAFLEVVGSEGMKTGLGIQDQQVLIE